MKNHALTLDLAVVMVTHDGDDVLGDVLTTHTQYTEKIFVLDTGDGKTTRGICAASRSVLDYRTCRDSSRLHEAMNSLILSAQQYLTPVSWLFFLGDDELPADDPYELAAKASAEKASSIVFNIADFYLTIGEMARGHVGDPGAPIWERRLYYSVHSSAAKACRNLPGLRCSLHSLFPRFSDEGDPLLNMASFRPVLRHYHFRSPNQIRRCLEDVFSGELGCSGAHTHEGRWFEYLIDERLLVKHEGVWRCDGKPIDALKAETATLARRRLCLPTTTVDAKSGPLVSVIISTYNRSRLLTSALRSALHQTYRNLEIIVIDDGSTDDTAGTVLGYADERITYMLRTTNSRGWRSVVRNEGVRISSGDYVCYLDDDNKWEAQHIQVLLEILESWPHVGMAYCDSIRHDRERQVSEDFNRQNLLRQNYIDTSEIMHRRECIDTVGMWEPALSCGQDWEFCLRISEEYPVVHVPIVLSHWFPSEDSVVHRLRKDETRYYDMIREAYKSGVPRPQRARFFRRFLGVPPLAEMDCESSGGWSAEDEGTPQWYQLPSGTNPKGLLEDFVARCLEKFWSLGPLCVVKAGPEPAEEESPRRLRSDSGDAYLRVESDDELRQLPAGRFGVVIASGLLERSCSPVNTLRLLRRVLKRGGALGLQLPFDAHAVPLEGDLHRLTPHYVADLLGTLFAQVEVEVAGHPRSPLLFLCTARKRGARKRTKTVPVELVLLFRNTWNCFEDWLDSTAGSAGGDTQLIVAAERGDTELAAALSRNRDRFSRAVIAPPTAGIQLLAKAIKSTCSPIFGVITVQPGQPLFPKGWLRRCLSAFDEQPQLGWIGGGTMKDTCVTLTNPQEDIYCEHPIVQLVRRKVCDLDELKSLSLRSIVESQGVKSENIAKILCPVKP